MMKIKLNYHNCSIITLQRQKTQFNSDGQMIIEIKRWRKETLRRSYLSSGNNKSKERREEMRGQQKLDTDSRAASSKSHYAVYWTLKNRGY